MNKMILIDETLLKAVLEAVEDLHRTGDTQVFDMYAAPELIPALREALAKQPAQQEPVATVVSESGNPNVSMSWWHEPALPVGTKLYTSPPPPQRTWVGLTDEERNDCLVSADPCECLAEPEAQQLITDVETKLREKNT